MREVISEIKSLKTELRAELKAELAGTKHTIITWVAGLLLAFAIAIIKFH